MAQGCSKTSKNFTVICPDLQGCGKSFKPQFSQNHELYSKRNIAKNIMEFMDLLGFNKFNIIGQ